MNRRLSDLLVTRDDMRAYKELQRIVDAVGVVAMLLGAAAFAVIYTWGI